MKQRTTTLLMLAGAIGCSGDDTPQPQASPSITIRTSTDVLAPLVEVVAPDDGEAAYNVAVEAIAHLSEGRTAAAEVSFHRLTAYCAGHAGLAYLAWDRGDIDIAINHWARAQLIRGRNFCIVDDSPMLGIQILTALRHSLDDISRHDGGNKTSLPCAVFEAHPAEAFVASAPYWGSSSDLYALDGERRCAWASLEASVRADQLDATRQALSELFRAHEDLVHSPTGTMWISFSYSAPRSLAQMLIAPEWTYLDVDFPRRRATAFAEARRHVPNFNARLWTFQQMSKRLLPVLAERVCDVAAHRGPALPKERCDELAAYALELAVVEWLECRPWDGFFLEGSP